MLDSSKQMDKESELYKSNDKPFFKAQQVKKCKDKGLKSRLQTLIYSKGMEECHFYNSLQISRQYWYNISWGLWDIPIGLKVKIAKALDSDTSAIWLKEGKNETN